MKHVDAVDQVTDAERKRGEGMATKLVAVAVACFRLWPGAVVAKQISFELVTVLLMGVINAGLHRSQTSAVPKTSRGTAEA